jgi:hypothetical protein
MAEQEPRDHAAPPGAEPSSGDSPTPASASAAREPDIPAPRHDPTASTAEEPPAPPVPEPGSEGPATSAADVWETFDAVLLAFGTERGVGVGTFWGEAGDVVEGRFANWSNTSGWRCSLQLVRAPEENVIVVVAQGPPLPGGRARMMVLGAFPPDFERDTLRAALEVGYGIGETWGPAEEPPEPSPGTAPEGPAPSAG